MKHLVLLRDDAEVRCHDFSFFALNEDEVASGRAPEGVDVRAVGSTVVTVDLQGGAMSLIQRGEKVRGEAEVRGTRQRYPVVVWMEERDEAASRLLDAPEQAP